MKEKAKKLGLVARTLSGAALIMTLSGCADLKRKMEIYNDPTYMSWKCSVKSYENKHNGKIPYPWEVNSIDYIPYVNGCCGE